MIRPFEQYLLLHKKKIHFKMFIKRNISTYAHSRNLSSPAGYLCKLGKNGGKKQRALEKIGRLILFKKWDSFVHDIAKVVHNQIFFLK